MFLLLSVSDNCRLCQDMREREARPTAGSSTSYSGSSKTHLDEHGRRKTIKPDSYFSDEDASD